MNCTVERFMLKWSEFGMAQGGGSVRWTVERLWTVCDKWMLLKSAMVSVLSRHE